MIYLVSILIFAISVVSLCAIWYRRGHADGLREGRGENALDQGTIEMQRRHLQELREQLYTVVKQRDAAVEHRKTMIAVGKIGRSKA